MGMLADKLYSPPAHPATQGAARLATRLHVRVRARVDTAALVATAQTFGISRVLLFVATYLAMALHPSVWGQAHPPSHTFWDAWYQWDARWYVRIARSGYHW